MHIFAEDKAVGNKRWRSYTILEVQVCVIIEITVLVLNTKSTTLPTRQQQNCSFLFMLQLNLIYFGLLFVLRKILGKQPTLKIFILTHKIFFSILGNIINGCISLH